MATLKKTNKRDPLAKDTLAISQTAFDTSISTLLTLIVKGESTRTGEARFYRLALDKAEVERVMVACREVLAK